MITATTAEPVLEPGTLTRLKSAECTPTQWATAKAKAEAGNRLLAFIESGLNREAFTPRLYRTCSQHLFGHIAHYDMHGFAAAWFATPHEKVAFIERALTATCTGDPAWTWCDVEQHIQTALAPHCERLLETATWPGPPRPPTTPVRPAAAPPDRPCHHAARTHPPPGGCGPRRPLRTTGAGLAGELLGAHRRRSTPPPAARRAAGPPCFSRHGGAGPVFHPATVPP